jgi:hypothetical protein
MNVFDMMKVTDILQQLKSASLGHRNQTTHLYEQLRDICDCKYPDDTSTWVSRFFGSQCAICGRNDY